MKNLGGKHLPISCCCDFPYYKPPGSVPGQLYAGGSDVLIVKILAAKLGFVPIFKPEKSIYPLVEANVTKLGLMHKGSSG